jgi:hypothetical protein
VVVEEQDFLLVLVVLVLLVLDLLEEQELVDS